MTENSAKYLADIIAAIEKIQSFVQEVEEESFFNNPLLQSAVERQLILIGEAANQLKKLGELKTFSNKHKIIAVRNRLVHAYISTEVDVIWKIVQDSLPELKDEATVLLKKYDEKHDH